MKAKEFILCAAIHYDDGKQYLGQPENIKSGYIITGLRHQNIIFSHIQLQGQMTTDMDERGFLTSHNRFVGREEAAKIATEAGQVPKELERLTSDDLY